MLQAARSVSQNSEGGESMTLFIRNVNPKYRSNLAMQEKIEGQSFNLIRDMKVAP